MPTYLHKPLYLQIQEYLAEKIVSGDLKPETRILSERELEYRAGCQPHDCAAGDH